MKRNLNALFSRNSDLLREMGLSLHSSLARMVDAILERLRKGPLNIFGPIVPGMEC